MVTSSATSLAHHCGQTPDLVIDNGYESGGVATVAASNAASDTDAGKIAVNCPTPTLTIAKTPDGGGGAGTIAAGSPGTFTIVITNTGNSTANLVTLDDVLPNDGGLTWTLISATRTAPAPTNVASLCAALVAGNTLDCDFGQLNAGATITVVVTSGNTSLAHHCQGPSPDLSLDNGTPGAPTDGDAVAAATGVTPVTDDGKINVTCPPPTLTIAKTPDGGGGAGTIAAGSPGTFTIVITNTGNSTANLVTLDDVLPNDGGLTWTLISATRTAPAPTNGASLCAALVAGNTLDCDFGQLNAGATITVVVTSGNTSLAHHCQGPSPDLSLDNGTPGAPTDGDAVAAATG